MARSGPRSAPVIARTLHRYIAADLDACIGARNSHKPGAKSAARFRPQRGLRFRQARRLRLWLGFGSTNVCATTPELTATTDAIVAVTTHAQNTVQRAIQ